jgi:hypothetical protein
MFGHKHEALLKLLCNMCGSQCWTCYHLLGRVGAYARASSHSVCIMQQVHRGLAWCSLMGCWHS